MTKDVVLIAGHYGDRNLGDDAIAQVLARAVTRLPHVEQVRILTVRDRPDIKAWTSKTEQLLLSTWSGLRCFMMLIAKVRVIIIGGGGILQDSTTFSNVAIHTLLPMLLRIFGVKIVVVGVGIGPLRLRRSRWLVRRMLRAAGMVLVRDKVSYQQCIEMRIPGTRLQIAPDLAWAWPEGCEVSSAEAPRRILLSFRPPLGSGSIRDNPTEDFLAGLVALTRRVVDFARANGIEVCFLSTHPLQDARVWNLIKAVSSDFDRLGCLAPETPEALWSSFSEGDILVGMRLHAMIFAAMNGIPTVAMAYAPKVSLVGEALGMGEHVLPFPLVEGGLDTLVEKLCAMSAEYYRASAEIAQQSRRLRDEAAHALRKLISTHV